MPIYDFEGRKEQTGEAIKGVREAASNTVLGQDLLSEGILLTRFNEKKGKSRSAGFFVSIFGRVPVLERLLFARYFALMLRAGLDVNRSIAALKIQTRSKPLKTALDSVGQGIEKGQTLADSMAIFPNAFSDIFISFVRVGEATGRLQESLVLLAQQLQKDYELRRAIKGGLMYPAVILVALITVGIAMMVFVIPKLVEVFEGFDVDLPLATRILIAISDFFQFYWYLGILGVFVVIVGGFLVLRVVAVKEAVMHGLLMMPVVGPIMQKISLARFTRSLSSLLESGVSFIQALDIMGKNTPHPSYAKVFIGAKEHVQQGKVLSEYLADFKLLFPSLVINIMKVGEETGELDEVLKEVALFYEGEIDQTMKNLTSIMEPVLMVVIGLAVGALAVSVISPIYGLVNVI